MSDSRATTVLVVDDEPQIQRALSVNLRARGYDVVAAGTAAQALKAAAKANPDLVVLDLGLPDADGMEVIVGIRGWSDVPIVILSIRGEEQDKVAALDAGADDYVTKPFGMDELLARVRATLRRVEVDEPPPIVDTTRGTIDLAARTIRLDGDAVHLTPTEWDVVAVLVRNRGRLVTKRQLLQEVWGPEYTSETNYLRVYLGRIRRKLEADPSRPRHFITESGMGYRFEA